MPRPSDDIPSLLKEIRDTLGRAVRKRLVADVPVGVFLSGGLDSSLVAALARPHVKRLVTSSVGMAGAPDRPFARQAAKALDTDHHERIYTAEEIRGALVQVIRHLESFDAPLVRSAIPCFFVAELARRHYIKVIQTGEGADELFSGYDYLRRIPGDEALGRELAAITFALHHTNLQRADRAMMVHGVEGRVPFLDRAMIRLGLGIVPSLKRVTPERPEKWLLRKAFDGILPPEVLWRPKQKFSEGAGSMHLLECLADDIIGETEFQRERRLPGGGHLRSREELLYYRIFRECSRGPAWRDWSAGPSCTNRASRRRVRGGDGVRWTSSAGSMTWRPVPAGGDRRGRGREGYSEAFIASP